MSRFLLSELRHRPWRAGTLALGILAAAVSFVLLTATASTSSLHVQGTLKSSFRPAYDILVRPARSETTLERDEGLVRPNFLSGIYGGISFKQWHEIERISDVAVAAPIANVGFVFPLAKLPVSLRGLTTAAAHQLYRVDASWVADNGLSRYPQGESYVYYAPRDRFVQADPTSPFLERGPDTRPVDSCDGFLATTPRQPKSPFPPLASQAYLSCFPSARGPNGNTVNGFWQPSPDFVGTVVNGYIPIYISAIDPVQEAKLVHLNRALVAGRYLHEDEGLIARPQNRSQLVPVLASDRSYTDEHLELTVRRLTMPPGTDLPRALASAQARSFASRLTGPILARRAIPLGTFYRSLLTQSPQRGWPAGTLFYDAYWTTDPTRYRQQERDQLAPLPVRNPAQIWQSQFSGWYTPPRDNLDPQFRRLHERVQSNIIVNGVARFHPLKVVGEFDPDKLPGFSPLTRVPLETYYPPTLLPANTAAEGALKGKPLTPSQNLGGYIQPPPLLLTTMRGLQTFLDPRNWSPGFSAEQSLTNGKNASVIPRAQRLAPISAIRVKVAGVTGPDPLSLERIKVVAQKIHDETGLPVDITAGSSPHPVEVALPKGNYGRPALLLKEGWSKKGVTVSFLRALDRKDLALFALVLVVCGFFLANGTLATVRTRRAEIGTLRTLGWPGRVIFGAILGELALVALAAGVAGTGLAALLVRLLGLDFPLWRTLLVLPLAVGLALLAGLGPAWEATRGEPLDAIRPPIAPGRRGRAHGIATLALLNLRRLPLRTGLGAAGLVLGVAALTVLLGIERAFQGTLVGTVLGSAISVQVRSADLVAAAITIALAALAVADVLYLNLRERAPELAALRTTGWAEAHLLRLVLVEALGLGLLGSLVGLAVGFLAGSLLLGVPAGSLAVGAAIAAAAGTAAALAAATVPTAQTLRAQPSVVLAGE